MGTIDEYLAGLDTADAEIIAGAYATARELVPDAEQGTSYGMPALLHQGRPLLSVMRAKGHFGVYPYSGAVVATVLDAIGPAEGLPSAKGTMRFPLGAAIPPDAIRRLVLARVEEIQAAKAPKPSRSARTTQVP